ncbi:hypothetical protein [Novosphingobium sp. CF614]|uniref:hypothetical protein n=1 Tax=Novosphingobium sp. CF614 TaxID=1884364 RepID=UPI0011603148|nr:hypothetical protein [Novosphingobium sp. CF614]
MNIAHDQKTCMTGHPQGHADDAFADCQLPIDWQDLRSRLFAAHDVRGVFSPGIPPGSSPGAKPLRLRLRGSFDGCAASVLTTYTPTSRAVNPTASTYGKPEEDNVPPVAGMSSSTGRRG